MRDSKRSSKIQIICRIVLTNSLSFKSEWRQCFEPPTKKDFAGIGKTFKVNTIFLPDSKIYYKNQRISDVNVSVACVPYTDTDFSICFMHSPENKPLSTFLPLLEEQTFPQVLSNWADEKSKYIRSMEVLFEISKGLEDVPLRIRNTPNLIKKISSYGYRRSASRILSTFDRFSKRQPSINTLPTSTRSKTSSRTLHWRTFCRKQAST